MTWTVVTLDRDPTHPLHPAARRAVRVLGQPGPAAASGRVTVTPPRTRDDHLSPCPACGTLTPPDMLLDVRPFPAALAAACGWSGREFVCDGCRETAHRTGALTHEQLATAHGAPAAVIALARAHDARLAALSPFPLP